MYKYEYTDLAKIPEIAKSISEIVPEEAVLLVKGGHFSYSEDFLPLEISKNLKKEVRMGFEILTSSFTKASPKEREEFFDYLDNAPYTVFEYGSGGLRRINSLPENVKVYGLRRFFWPAKSLVKDFHACLKYYNQFSQEEINSIYTKEIIDNNLDVVVLGEIHIEPIRRKLQSRRNCLKVIHEDPTIQLHQIQDPDILIKAII